MTTPQLVTKTIIKNIISNRLGQLLYFLLLLLLQQQLQQLRRGRNKSPKRYRFFPFRNCQTMHI